MISVLRRTRRSRMCVPPRRNNGTLPMCRAMWTEKCTCRHDPEEVWVCPLSRKGQGRPSARRTLRRWGNKAGKERQLQSCFSSLHRPRRPFRTARMEQRGRLAVTSAETQACAEGLETAQYLRSMCETAINGYMTDVDKARLPILCLSDCLSLYDHLNRQGDKRLAVDLAALKQGLRSEKWSDHLPLGWIPGTLQRSNI